MASSSSVTWTAEDIRKNAAAWSLEGDAKLLEFMQKISQNLEKRATTTKNNINHLTLNVEHTSIALDNATNKLAALQHSQFVENRVYEDDEIITNGKNVSVDMKDQQKPYNPTDILKTILNNSLTVLDECYDKISLSIEDSDEEDESSKSIIYMPKDPFDQRPLPHIIGTKEWKEKWHIGLCDSDEDYSDDDNDDEYSSDSESENISLTASLPSNAPTVSESEISSTWGLQRNNITTSNSNKMKFINSSDDDIDEISSNTITSRNSESEESGNRITIPSSSSAPQNISQMIDKPIPDQRYYIHKPKEKNLFDESSSNGSDDNDNNIENHRNTFKNNSNSNKIHENLQQQILKSTNQNNINYNRISNIINDEPPPDLDEVDRDKLDDDKESNQQRNSQYFIENDTEYSSLSDKKASNKGKDNHKDELYQPTENHDDNNRLKINTRKKTVNLFDDDDFNSFMKELSEKNSEKASEDKVKNLFEDDESENDEDSIFNMNKKLSHESVQIVTKAKDKRNISTESSQKIEISPPPTLPSKHQDNKIEEKLSETKTNILNLFDDTNDDFDTIFGSKKNESNALFKDKNLNSNKPINNTTKNNNNDGDVDDDIFNVDDNRFIVDKNKNKNTNQNRIQSENKINLFSNNSLLDNDDGDDLFENNKNNSTNDDIIIIEKKNDKQQVIKESSSLKKSENYVNLFDDKNENDKINNELVTNTSDNIIQNTINNNNNLKINKLPNFFFDEDEDDDDDIFGFKRQTTVKVASVAKEKNNLKKDDDSDIKKLKNITTHSTSLFSDNEDDEDDVFAFVKKSKNNATTIAKSNLSEENTKSNEDQTPVDSEDKFENDQNNDDDDKFNSSINKNVLSTKISTLMNLFSDEPPSDDGDDDIFRFNTVVPSSSLSNKSKSDQITEKLPTSMSSKLFNNENNENNNYDNDIIEKQETHLPSSSSLSVIDNETPDTHKNLENSQLLITNKSENNDDKELLIKSNSKESNAIEIEKVPDNGENVYQQDNNKFSQKLKRTDGDDVEIENDLKNHEKTINTDEILNDTNEKEEIKDKNSFSVENELNSPDDIVQDEMMNKNKNNINSGIVVNKKEDEEEIVPKNDDQITSITAIIENDDNIVEESITPKNIFEHQNSVTQLSTLNYNPIGLFQDIPPEDDFQFPSLNNEQKQQHTHNIIFYDDFAETITASQASSNNVAKVSSTSSLSSNYNIFSDEPPPDIFLDEDNEIPNADIKTTAKATTDIITNHRNKNDDKETIEKSTNSVIEKSKDTTGKLDNSIIENAEKSKTVAELAKKVNAAASTSKNLESFKPSAKLPSPPKKLNTNLNINVAALLPGAKRPTTISDKNENSNSNLRSSSNEEVVSSATRITVVPKYSIAATTTTTNTNDSDHSILTSLNKTRAKIPIKRRPSTRKARQENYRKSLITSDDVEYSDEISDKKEFSHISDISDLVNNTEKTNLRSDESERVTNNVMSDQINEVTTSKTNENDPFNADEQQSSVIISSQKLFDDDDDDFQIIAPKEIKAKEEFINDRTFNQTKTTDILSNKTGALAAATKIIPKLKNNILGSDEDDDGDLFAQNKKVLPSSKSLISQKSEQKLTTTNNAKTTVNTTTEIKSKKSINNSKSIFEDDTDDDDLFATKLNVKTKQNSLNIEKQEQPVKKQSNVHQQPLKKQSIFSSDDDDDDDLFGGGKLFKKTPKLTMNKTENIENLKSHQHQQTTSIAKTGNLFGDNELDDDDDGDLFGGGNKSSKTLQKSLNVPAPKKTERKIIASKKDLSDNPLSDLLKD